MSTIENTIQPLVLDEPVCSSDSVWYKEDVNTSVTTVLDNKASLSHSHPEYASSDHTHTEYAPLVHEHSGYAPSTHEHTGYAPTEHTHTGYATEDHTHTEYAAVDHTHTGFAAEAHNHDTAYIAKALQMVSDNGSVQTNITADVTAFMVAAPGGVHTYYAASGVTNNPKTVEAWRFLVHKTDSGASGWVLAFGSEGSVYDGYINNGTWKGWHCLYDYSPVPLWTGAMYMTETHEVIPSKTLSNCRNGWMLLWSDYDPGENYNNTDFATTFIPKRAYTGQIWNGGQFLNVIPRFAESGNEATAIKAVNVYDAKLTGVSYNDEDYRNDIVLRAVYEF